MVKRFQKSALVAVFLSLCLLLCTAVICFAASPAKAEGETETPTESTVGTGVYYSTTAERATADMQFIARDGLVYTGTEYKLNRDINALLTSGSDKITDDMTVKLVGYTGTDGVAADTLPTVVKNAGTYSLEITVEDKKISLAVTIGQATNEWVRVPNIVPWSYGTFDTQVNRIRAVVKFLSSDKPVLYSVLDIDENVIEELSGFTVRQDGTITDSAIVDALNGLKAGGYKLQVVAQGTDNYKALEQTINFNIDKAANAWADGNDDLKLPSWIVGNYNAKDNAIVVNAAHGEVNIVVADIDGKEYYNSTTGLNKLGDCAEGKYLVKAWVNETEDYDALPERTFTIEVLEKVGLPWWATLCITLGALLIVALIIFILLKTKVFRILTEKMVVSIRTKASVDATIASVRAAKRMEDGKKSVADAKRRERIEKMQQRAKEQRAMSPEQRAAQLEAKARLDDERAEKLRAKSEAKRAKAATLRGEPTEAVESVATETTETPTEE